MTVCLILTFTVIFVKNFSFVKALSLDEDASVESTEFVSDTTNDATEIPVVDNVDNSVDNLTDNDANATTASDCNVTESDEFASDEAESDTVCDDNDETPSLYAILYDSGELHFSNQTSDASDIVKTYVIDSEYSAENHAPWYERRMAIKYVTSDDVKMPKSMAYWFFDCENITDFDLSNFDMTEVSDMNHMFDGCDGVSQIMLGEHFKFMGSDCYLPSIDGRVWMDRAGKTCISSDMASNTAITYKSIPVTYKVVYDANNGSGTMSEQTFEYGESRALLTNTFTRKGYVFEDWNTRSDDSGDSYDDEQSVVNLSTENNDVVTLYAQWKPISCTIRFDSNHGFGIMSDTKFIYGNHEVLPQNVFLRDGYEFIGWFISRKEGSEWFYDDESWYDAKPGASVAKYMLLNEESVNFTYDDGDVITLHAQWKPVDASTDAGNGQISDSNALDDNLVTDDVKVAEIDDKSVVDYNTNSDIKKYASDADADSNTLLDIPVINQDDSNLFSADVSKLNHDDETVGSLLAEYIQDELENSVNSERMVNDDVISDNDVSNMSNNITMIPTSADTNVNAMLLIACFGVIATLCMLFKKYTMR